MTETSFDSWFAEFAGASVAPYTWRQLTGRSWRERTSSLVDRFGPGASAWLEALLIAADRRASQLTTIDPLLDATSSEVR